MFLTEARVILLKYAQLEATERYKRKCSVPENSRRDKKDFLSEQCKEIEENRGTYVYMWWIHFDIWQN